MAVLSELLKNLDPDKRIRGRQFEHICKWFLQNDPRYRLEIKTLWLWNEWPGRWGPDAGIDLVSETFNGKLWAIQAKAYDPNHSITKADVDTFLSESSRSVFSFRLLIATTNLIGKTADRTLLDQEKPIGRILLSDLKKSDLSWPSSPKELLARPLKPKTPLPHQQNSISDVYEAFSEHYRGQLIMACGTGKTLVGLWVSEKLQCKRTLVLLPSLSLLAQTLREWTANTCRSFHYLPVCSDDTVRGSDRLISKTSDLGFPVTTDPNEVASFLRRRGPTVVFATYQSSPVVAEAFKHRRVPSFDLAIADEAHRCAGPAAGQFATILHATNIKARRRLFMTATPRYFTDRVRKEVDQVEFELASMDDESRFGPVFHHLSFADAIDQDLLSDYQVVIVGVDNPTYRKYAERATFVTTHGNEVTDARTLASHIALAKAMRKYDLQRVISFHGRIRRANEFSSQLPDVIRWMPKRATPSGDIWSKYVAGTMSSGKRDALLDRFRELGDGERGLLANARCLAEGVDVPTLDGVAFIDPRRSQVDIVQAVGRVIRKAPDKKVGTVILPVFIEKEDDAETTLSGSVFKPVWDVLKALRSHDEILAEELDHLRRQLGHYGRMKGDVPKKIHFDLPITVGKSFAESFSVKLVEQSTASWEFWYGLLESFSKEQGHTLVPSEYKTKDSFTLGTWVAHKRADFKKGKLSKDKIRALEKLPKWVWDRVLFYWEEGLRNLQEYVELYGTANVPVSYVTNSGHRLGGWVSHQRNFYHVKKLDPFRVKILENFPGWTWNPVEEYWKEGYSRLLEYLKVNGDVIISTEYVSPEGFNLGGWVSHQRRAYNQRVLSSDKVKMLEYLLGWSWDPKEDWWREGYLILIQYCEQYGHALVPLRLITEKGFKLGSWVSIQRKSYRDKKISNERIKLLESLDGWSWDPIKYRWLKGLQLLKEYFKINGHPNVPISYVTKCNFRLGHWVSTQRNYYKNGKLSKERIYVLEQFEGWLWNTLEDAWQNGFKRLSEFVEKHNSSLVPGSFVTKDGFNLGNWVLNQRTKFSNGKLSKDKIVALESISGWVWNTLKAKWDEGLKKLEEYVNHFGLSLVPFDFVTIEGFKLGDWVVRQRRAFKVGKLTPHMKKTLQQLPGWSWDPVEDLWKEGLKQLSQYVKESKSTLVPSKFITSSGLRLGHWVGRQRKDYRLCKLTKEKVSLLEAIQGWTWNPHEYMWQEGLRYMQQYVRDNDNALVAAKYITDGGFRLGGWLSEIRKRYKKGKLSANKVGDLEKIPGWSWDPNRDSWRKGFDHLINYVKENGIAIVPKGHKIQNGFNLDEWVWKQRTAYRRGKLAEKMICSLEELSGWSWDPLEDKWRKAYQLLLEFKSKEGHCLVPFNYVTADGYKLGSWVSIQRKSYREGKLPPERRQALERILVWSWDPLEAKWNAGLEKLKRYAEEHGTPLVPDGLVTDDGFKLGIWVGRHRRAYRKGKLAAKKVKTLKQIPGWTWNPFDDLWQDGLKYLQDFVEEKGSALVPISHVTEDGFKLGSWVTERRKAYRKGRLSQERSKVLKRLPGWSWNIFNAKWKENFKQLQKCVEREGHSNLPYNYVSQDGFHLGLWIFNQRKAYRAGKLSNERKRELEQLLGWAWAIRKNPKISK